MFSKRILLFLLAAITVFSVIGCGSANDETSKFEVSIPVLSTEETKPELEPGYVFSPLTGLPVKEEIGTLRPVGFQVDNERIARPQCGISMADVVYEVPIEANEVRLTAIFQDLSVVDRVGPLRSCRKYHPGILAEYEGILVHNGHSKYAVANLNDDMCDDIELVNKDYDTQFRSDDHKTGHNNFTNKEKLEKRFKHYGFERMLSSDFTYKFLFAKNDEPNLLPQGKIANKVETGYTQNHSYFEYNEGDGLYYRYAWGDKHIDGDTDKQIAVKNIIIEYCKYDIESDHKNKDIHTVGSGKGAFVTNGKVVNITWEKDGYWDNTHYYYENGEEIMLNPGKSWVCIVLPSMTGECKFS